ncbi:hypothetical protein HGM15179_019805 [Zosterops borbonicus]|uniref:Uncharacterized protein n=1 Tax=Zosterops borbonicus TaxID=364589 RepID=A0A8K1D9X1_9PASS|nr:hypothetical protein HGM15179_019805 [Zosterops borbonicus]
MPRENKKNSGYHPNSSLPVSSILKTQNYTVFYLVINYTTICYYTFVTYNFSWTKIKVCVFLGSVPGKAPGQTPDPLFWVPGLSTKVKPMDKEREKAASEEKEKGIAFALLECVGVFSGGFVSILFVLETKHVIKNIQWTKAKNFTVERGRQQIEELISTWDIHESWLHHSEFLDKEELRDSKRYHYRACWGLPTRRKPVPRATASVYFVIVISKFQPDTAPVQVFYRLESSRLIRRWKWFGSSSLGGASHNGMMQCVMSLVSFNGPVTEDIPQEDGKT